MGLTVPGVWSVVSPLLGQDIHVTIVHSSTVQCIDLPVSFNFMYC